MRHNACGNDGARRGHGAASSCCTHSQSRRGRTVEFRAESARHLAIQKAIGRHLPPQAARPVNECKPHRRRPLDNTTPIAWAGPPAAKPPDQGPATDARIHQTIMANHDRMIMTRPQMHMSAMAAGAGGGGGGHEGSMSYIVIQTGGGRAGAGADRAQPGGGRGGAGTLAGGGGGREPGNNMPKNSRQ